MISNEQFSDDSLDPERSAGTERERLRDQLSHLKIGLKRLKDQMAALRDEVQRLKDDMHQEGSTAPAATNHLRDDITAMVHMTASSGDKTVDEVYERLWDAYAREYGLDLAHRADRVAKERLQVAEDLGVMSEVYGVACELFV